MSTVVIGIWANFFGFMLTPEGKHRFIGHPRVFEKSLENNAIQPKTLSCSFGRSISRRLPSSVINIGSSTW